MLLNLLFFMFSWTVSFICSGFEIGMLSVNELKIKAFAQNGSVSAKIMSKLLNDKEKVLTTLLILNTVALIILIFSFDKIIAAIFPQVFSGVLQTLVLTVIVFVSCELFPKSLFRIYSFELTRGLVFFVFFAYKVFLPISSLFMFVSQKIKKGDEVQSQNYQLHEIALEGARRRLLPVGVSVLVNKFSKINLKLCDICKEVEATRSCGKSNIVLKSTQYMDEVIKRKILWNYDTIECIDIKKGEYYPTVAILDSFFKMQRKL
jgi:Mg2+/Co2+ transporter CorB